jgi:hypothetical protein
MVRIGSWSRQVTRCTYCRLNKQVIVKFRLVSTNVLASSTRETGLPHSQIGKANNIFSSMHVNLADFQSALQSKSAPKTPAIRYAEKGFFAS